MSDKVIDSIYSFNKLLENHGLEYPSEYYVLINDAWKKQQLSEVDRLFEALPLNFKSIAIINERFSLPLLAYLITKEVRN